MGNGATNIDRLIAADLIDTTYLTDALRAKFNACPPITDEEIKALQEVKKKLKLDKIQPGVGVGPAAGGV